AVNRGLQAAGRVIRSESERGVILFCDRRFGDSGQGSVSEFLPDWVREDMILVDAKEGRELIIKKIADWKMKGPSQSRSQSLQNREQNGGALNENQQAAKISPRSKSGKSAKATKSGKRDLRELARALGLGTGAPAARAGPKPGPKSSREKGQN
ncbi:MAG: helicase C-terminal domain-containing protein, partial [Methanothrix sp.]|nr:helicase C-terminal domain-containing protein [Methanothrix sp.]